MKSKGCAQGRKDNEVKHGSTVTEPEKNVKSESCAESKEDQEVKLKSKVTEQEKT